MTPNTFEAITLQGLYGGEDGRPEWRLGGGYFDEIKERNSDEFVSMAQDAGAPDGVERGVYALGANYKMGEFSFGAIDYYSDDIINIFYSEAKYGIPLAEKTKLQAFFGEGKSAETVLNDLFWSLLNAKEFVFNH